jgi:hypothetical protein
VNVPQPADQAFVDRVRELVCVADLEARTLAGMPRRRAARPSPPAALERVRVPPRVPAARPARTGPRPDLPAEAKTVLKRQGRCRGCACLWDDFTPDCRNCEARHQMRRLYVERAAAA